MEKDIMIMVSTFLSICGGIAIIGGAGVVIRKWLNPAFKIAERVETLEKHDITNSELLEEIVKTNKMLCRCMVILLDHEITGNSIEKIKEIKNEMQTYLIEK